MNTTVKKKNKILSFISSLHTKRTMDMTTGSIFRLIISFAAPLLVGNLFQQLYNTVDSYIVGNYVSNEAFAAVGNTGPIINTLIGFFSGLATGAGVIISQYFGAKDEHNVRRAVHTTITMTFLLSVIFTAIGVLMVPGMLNLMKTPADVFPEAKTYLTIYFSGISGLMIYNVGAGILRAVGDSQRPFYFLVITAILNAALDLLFVLAFGMGVEGVAIATIISQFVSAILVIITLTRSKECFKLRARDLGITPHIISKIIKVGFPAALQMAITSFSNVFIQSYINHFGTNFMSGYTAYAKIDQFLLLPMQSVALASTTFVGQNLGARNSKRAKQGANVALLISVSITVILMIPVLIFAPYLVAFFNNESAEVIKYGAELLRLISPFYVLCCINQIYAGALRGAGKATVPMVIMISCFVFFRQGYLALVSHLTDSYHLVALGYPAGWLMCSIIIFIYYRISGWENKVLVKHGDN